MLIKTLPKIDIVKSGSAENVILDFYRALGWNGEDNLLVKKVRMSKVDYRNVADTLMDIGKDQEQRMEILILWGNYAPSVDDSVKEGTVVMLEGFTS